MMLKMKVLEDSELFGVSFFSFFSFFFLVFIIAIMIAAITISSELNFINDEKFFTEKEPVYVTLFEVKFFKLI